MEILTTQLAGSSFGTAGKAFWRRRSAGSLPQTLEMPLPTGYNLTDTNGSWCTYLGRLYAAGIGTDNAVVDENFRFMRDGIQPPSLVPVLAAAAGPGRTGACVVYLSFRDSISGERSPLSGASNSVTLANQAATITNVPTTSNDDRVDQVEVWISMHGGLPRLSTRRDLGVSTITENVATLALGEAFTDTFERMPRGSMNTIYADRRIVAGDARHPDIAYVSLIGFPERYGGLSFRTKNGEPITGLANVQNDVCLVYTPLNCYVLRGYRDADMTMKLLHPAAGAVNAQCIDFTHDGWAISVNQNGFWMFNGAFHNISQDRQLEWKSFYKDNRAQVDTSFGVVDPNEHTYTLYVTSNNGQLTVPLSISSTRFYPFPGTLAWVADYRPISPSLEGGMGQPHWSYDIMSRAVDSAGRVNLPGSNRQDVYLGFCDGFVRIKDPTDDDDDGDSHGKRVWIRTKANDFGDPGGSPYDGKRFTYAWTYIVSETKVWRAYFRGGDEETWRSILPDNGDVWWFEDVPAGAATHDDGTTLFTSVPQSIWDHEPKKVQGRTLTMDYTMLNALGMFWRGFGGHYGPGRVTRPPSSAEGLN